MLMTWRERHKRLVGRIGLVFLMTLAVDAVGTVAIYLLERHARGTEVHTFGQALFFSTVQILTVSSQIKNPLTAGGRVVDVFLEIWALFVVTTIAGSFAAFFGAGDP